MIELGFEAGAVEFGAKLKVIGCGGAGSNAVNSMIAEDWGDAVEFIIANTDAQALTSSPSLLKIQLGEKLTKGLGAGSNPDVGRRAAEESIEEIKGKIVNTDILFLTAGFGGGTGSGALPVIAHAAKELGILTVAIITKPFMFEGKRRLRQADEAIKSLKNVVDTLIIVPNQRLIEVADPKISMLDAFALSNKVLEQAIKGISNIIMRPGLINVDFADVRFVMKDMGMAIMGTGRCSGEDRAKQAAIQAISSPLLENMSIQGARGVLINITGNKELGLREINDAANVIYELVSEDANIILGSVIDEAVGSDVIVTVIATGFETEKYEEKVVVKQPEVHVQSVKVEEVVQKEALHESEILALLRKFDLKARAEVFHQGSDFTAAQKQEVAPDVEKVMQAAPLNFEAEHLEVTKLTNSNEPFDLNDLDTPTYLRKKSELNQ